MRRGLASRQQSRDHICLFPTYSCKLWAFLVAQMVKNLPALWKTQVQSVGQEDSLEKGMATFSIITVWRIPWTEEPGGLGSMGSQNQTRLRDQWFHFHSKCSPELSGEFPDGPVVKTRHFHCHGR